MSAILDAVLKSEDPQRWADVQAYDATLRGVSAEEKAALLVSRPADGLALIRSLLLQACAEASRLHTAGEYTRTEWLSETLDACHDHLTYYVQPADQSTPEERAKANAEHFADMVRKDRGL